MEGNKVYIYLIIFILSILQLAGCGTEKNAYMEATNTESESENIEWQKCYIGFLEEALKNKDKEDVIEFAIKDLDNNGIPEIIVAKNGVDISVYTFDSKICEAGSCNYGGTTRLFFSNDSLYPGIFYFHVGGGLEHHGYMTIKENSLIKEELWNYDYSGISEETGEKRDKTLEISLDKQLINESKEVYSQNQDLLFEELNLENIEHEIMESSPSPAQQPEKTTNKWLDNTEKVAYKGDFTTPVERTDTLDCNIKNLYIGESPKGSLYQMRLDVPDIAKVSEGLLNIGFFYFEKDRIYRMLELSQDEQSKLLKDGEIPDSATIVCQDEEIKDKNNNKGWHERIDRNEDVVEYYRWNDENTTNFYEHIFWKENIGIILYRRGYAAELDSITMWREEYVSNPHE